MEWIILAVVLAAGTLLLAAAICNVSHNADCASDAEYLRWEEEQKEKAWAYHN